MISIDCPNHEMIRLLTIGVMVLLALAIFILYVLIKILNEYEDIYVKLTIIKNDYDFNKIISLKDIQKKLCPYDLIDVNNRHLFELDECKACKSKACKEKCWKQYFIDKLKEN